MTKAIIGIGSGLVLTGIAVTGLYFLDPLQKLLPVWVITSLLSWPMLGWGEGQFAKYRGYSGAAGYGLTGLGFLIELFLVARNRNPWAYAVGFLFVASLPIVVLLALPQKAHRNRTHHRRSKE